MSSSFMNEVLSKTNRELSTQKNSNISTEHFLALICENELLKSHLEQSKLQTKRWRKQFRNAWKAFKIVERGSSGKYKGEDVVEELISLIQNCKELEKQLEESIQAFSRRDKEIIALQRGMDVIVKEKDSLEVEVRNLEEELNRKHLFLFLVISRGQ